MNEANASSWLTPEWQQRGLNALLETFDVEPNLRREMVEFLMDTQLWDPTKTNHQSALARFNACMIPGRQEFFRPSHLWALMKHFDRHQFFLAMADDLEYDVRRRPTPERIQRAYERAAIALEQNTAALAHVDTLLRQQSTASIPLRVSPAFRDRSGSFQISDEPSSSGNGDTGI